MRADGFEVDVHLTGTGSACDNTEPMENVDSPVTGEESTVEDPCTAGDRELSPQERRIDEGKAYAIANAYVTFHYSTMFAANRSPSPVSVGDPAAWRFAILLAPPGCDPVGEIGSIVVDRISGKIVEVTPYEEVLITAKVCYEANRTAIEAAFVFPRKD